MYPSNYDTGFMQGVTIRNIPVEITQSGNSNVFWVSSTVGSNGNQGNFLHPFSSIAYAISKCSGNGDRIFVAAGHIEQVTSAGGLNLNVPGVVIEFLGEGSLCGTINFSTVVGVSMTITAANVTLINPRFTAGIDALTGPISITSADFTMINGEWFDAPAMGTTNCIVATTAATRLGIYGFKYFGSTTGTQKAACIVMTGVAFPTLMNINIAGDFSTACINNATTACTGMILEKMRCHNINATPHPAMVLQAGCTGMAKNCDMIVASGVTFISSVAALNWDAQCLGYHAGGQTGTPLATYS